MLPFNPLSLLSTLITNNTSNVLSIFILNRHLMSLLNLFLSFQIIKQVLVEIYR